MEVEMFGWREGMLLLLGLAVLFLVATVIRLLRILRHSAASDAAPPTVRGSEHQRTPDAPDNRPGEETPVRAALPPGGFGEQLARADLERELRCLRREVDALRVDLDDLRAARHISPHYAEAMSLAQRGLSARDVADRMGISLAEAELVHALSRGQSLFAEPDIDDGLPVRR